MNDNSLNCLIGILLVAGVFLSMRRDEGSYKRIRLVEVKEIARRQETDERIDGEPIYGECREVVIIQANGIHDLKRWTDGTTIEGARTRVHTVLGNNMYMLSSVAWHTDPPKKHRGESVSQYAARLRANGWRVRE